MAARKWRRCSPNSCTRTDRSVPANAVSVWLLRRPSHGFAAHSTHSLSALCGLCLGDHSNCPAEFPIYMLKHSANGEDPGEVSCCPGHATAELSSARSTGQHLCQLCADMVTRVSDLMYDLHASSRILTSWTKRPRMRGARTGDTNTEPTTSAGPFREALCPGCDPSFCCRNVRTML